MSPLPDAAQSWLEVPDRLLCSLSTLCRAEAITVILSGMLPAGLEGMRAVLKAGRLQ